MFLAPIRDVHPAVVTPQGKQINAGIWSFLLVWQVKFPEHYSGNYCLVGSVMNSHHSDEFSSQG